MSGWRLAVHVHSEWSYDGTRSLEELSRLFGRLGYDAVLMAEHDVTFDDVRWERYRHACADAGAAGALLVPGIEYSDADNVVHVPVWGARDFLGAGLRTGELLARAETAGAVAVLAHPARRDAWRRVEPEWLDRLHGIECWNRKYDGTAPSRIAVDLLRHDRRLRPFVGLDYHRHRQLFPMSCAVAGHGPLMADSVVDGLRRAFTPRVLGVPIGFWLRPRARVALGLGDAARAAVARRVKR